MLILLSPAKTIDTSPHEITPRHTHPEGRKHAEELVSFMRTFDSPQLQQVMKVSRKLADLNLERFVRWKKDPEAGDAMQALLAFSGEVFNGLDARSLNEEDLLFAQDHLRILSGLYGVLRPLDLIMPYRLEMGTKSEFPGAANLYDYWSGIIPATIKEAADHQPEQVLVNLASNEYFRAIGPRSFPHRIITPVFKEQEGHGYRNVTIYAKKARGVMTRFIIENRIIQPEHLKAFDKEGYHFNPDLSDGDRWFFTR